MSITYRRAWAVLFLKPLYMNELEVSDPLKR
jgi:hypothetical protein